MNCLREHEADSVKTFCDQSYKETSWLKTSAGINILGKKIVLSAKISLSICQTIKTHNTHHHRIIAKEDILETSANRVFTDFDRKAGNQIQPDY